MREHLEALEKARDFMLTKIDAGTTRYINHNTVRRLEGVMNSADKPHWDADSSVSSVLRRSPVFRISKSFLSKFITPSKARKIAYLLLKKAAQEHPAGDVYDRGSALGATRQFQRIRDNRMLPKLQ